MIVGRYFRLMTPILLGCLIVYGLAVSGLVQNPMRRAAASDLVTVVRFGLYRFLNAFTDPATVPIPQLWTMPYEAEGSIFALGVLWVAGTSRLRFGAYIAALVFGHPMFASFAVGMFLAELSRVPMTPASRRVVSIAATCLLVPSLALVALLPGSTEFRVMWVSSMVAACAVFSDTAKSFLSNGISTRLAQISFPLYILHGAVIFSLGTFLHRFARTPCAILAVNVITGIGAAAFAFAFRWIDTAGIAIARSLGRLLPRERHLDPRPVSAV
jgi:peptidoglycan/LPS O-acetylase OafA/YrhL